MKLVMPDNLVGMWFKQNLVHKTWIRTRRSEQWQTRCKWLEDLSRATEGIWWAAPIRTTNKPIATKLYGGRRVMDYTGTWHRRSKFASRNPITLTCPSFARWWQLISPPYKSSLYLHLPFAFMLFSALLNIYPFVFLSFQTRVFFNFILPFWLCSLVLVLVIGHLWGWFYI